MSDPKRSHKHTQTVQIKPLLQENTGDDNRKALLTVIQSGRRDLGIHTLVVKEVTLGRSPDCELCLHDLGISWRHARVTLVENTYLLDDLDSTNGTILDGVKIDQPQPLRDGQKVFIGDTVIRFSFADDMEIGFHGQLAQLAGTDSLTGLDSKQKFDSNLEYVLLVACQMKQPLSVLMMDLDGIKQINDTHGHLFGAFTIERTGKIIAKVLQKSGQACRFGGDEFTAFLLNQDKAAAVDIAEKIRLAVETDKIEKNSIALHPTICIGVASFPEDGSTVTELLTKADQALYRAKSKGKNRVST